MTGLGCSPPNSDRFGSSGNLRSPKRRATSVSRQPLSARSGREKRPGERHARPPPARLPSPGQRDYLVLFVTGYLDAGLEQECRVKGIAWVQVPASIDEMRRELRIALDDPAL